jgi:hypothetical protein
MSCVLVLLIAIGVLVGVVGLVLTSNSCPLEGASTPPFIFKGTMLQGM